MTFIDTHAHLDDARFQQDLPDVLARAQAQGVIATLCIGIDATTSRAAVQLAKQYPQLRAVVGIQPNHVAEIEPGDWDMILQLAEAPEVVGIGESGLDRYWDRAPFAIQEAWFDRHLQLARSVRKPIVIHCREAEADVVRVLNRQFERQGPIRGVMHSFCGDETTMRECVRFGLNISFAGMLTYKTAGNIRTVAALVPPERLLVETDAPYLAPLPKRGQRNEPAFVVHTAECLAQCQNLTLDEIARHTTANAKLLFSL